MEDQRHVRLARFAAIGGALVLAAGLSACGGGTQSSLPSTGQQSGVLSGQRSIESIEEAGDVTAADANAASGARTIYRHALGRVGAPVAVPVATAPVGFFADEPGGNLLDHHGPRLETVISHNVYINCGKPLDCWGDPAGFLQNLAQSNFIHVADQYIGLPGSDRYTVGTSQKLKYPTPNNILYDVDIETIVHHVAAKLGAGYTHEYHVFLPQGTDECFDGVSGICYSPDNLKTFAFCAYHSYVDFADIGHILYSVEPYQETPGCGDTYTPTNAPKGSGAPPHTLTDSTATVVSHELFETITDPNGSAWFNAFGFEIGDLCAFHRNVINLNGTNYTIQPEWSNRANAGAGDCVTHT